MTDIAKLAIEIESGGAKTGADQAVQSAERVKTSFTGMDKAASAANLTLGKLSPAATGLAKEYQRLREEVRSGAIAHDEFLKRQQVILDQMARLPPVVERWTQAQQRGETESAKFSRAVQHQVNQLKGLAATAQQAAAQEERLVALRARLAGTQARGATQLVEQGKAATDAASGFAKLERPLIAASLAAGALPGPLGRAASALSLFAVGGPVTVGVLAGIAIVAAAWERWHKPLKELEERLDQIREKNRDPLIQLRLDRETIEQQLKEVEERIARTRARIAAEPLLERAAGVQSGLERDLAEQAGLYQKLGLLRREQATEDARIDDEKRQRIAQLRDLEFRAGAAVLQARGQDAQAQLNLIQGTLDLRLEEIAASKDLTQAEKDRAAAAEKTLAATQRQAVLETQALERRREAAQLSQAEAQTQALLLTARGRSADAERVLLDARLKAQLDEVRAMEHLTAQEKARLTVALETVAAYQRQSIAMRQAAEVLAKINADFARQQTAVAVQQERTRRSPEGQIKALEAGIDAFNRGFADDIARLLDELYDLEAERLARIVEDHHRATQATVAFLVGIEAISPAMANALSAANDLAAAIEAFARKIATAEDVAEAASRLGAALPRTSAIGAGAGGALQGGAAGYEIAGPVGAVVGGIGGAVASLVTFGKSAREAERQFRDAVREWNRSLDDWLAGITGSMSTFEREAQDARRTAEQRFKEILGFAKSKGLEFDFGKDVEVASEEEFRRFLEIAAQYGGEFRDEIRKLIETYEAATAALEEQRRQAEKALQDDLEVRRLEAEGRSDEAAIRRQQIAADRELQDALKEKYSAATIAALKHVHALEAEALAAEQAAAAAEQLRREQDFGADLELRRRVATGDPTADAYRRQLEREREVRDAVAAGMSEYNIELLKQVQAIEDVIAAQRKAREELAVSQDLDVRFLRSLGQGEAADELERQVERDREVQRAVDAGWTPAQIEFLRQIQQNEERQRLQIAEAERNAPAQQPASLSTKDITSLSETTGVRIDSRLFTMTFILRESLLVQRQIERNTGRAQAGGGVLLQVVEPDVPAITRAVDRSSGEQVGIQSSAAGQRPTV